MVTVLISAYVAGVFGNWFLLGCMKEGATYSGAEHLFNILIGIIWPIWYSAMFFTSLGEAVRPK